MVFATLKAILSRVRITDSGIAKNSKKYVPAMPKI
jgi:hypothetical protein